MLSLNINSLLIAGSVLQVNGTEIKTCGQAFWFKWSLEFFLNFFFLGGGGRGGQGGLLFNFNLSGVWISRTGCTQQQQMSSLAHCTHHLFDTGHKNCMHSVARSKN